MNENTIATKRNLIIQGIRAYCHKTGFSNVMLGLSGGMDSALVLVLACEAMGAEHVHSLMMATKYTSRQSIDLAQEAANLNNVNHTTLDIQPILNSLLATLPFTPQNPVTEQNLQARARGIINMAYSNEYGYLLLACGNKSEAAMGYCTLYGDICGGISPIADLYKTEVYAMADLYNQEGKYFVPREIIRRPPTAELAYNQKDTDSLLSYDILDPILKDYIYDKKEIPEDIRETVTAVQRKFDAAAFKRAQSPFVIPATKE